MYLVTRSYPRNVGCFPHAPPVQKTRKSDSRSIRHPSSQGNLSKMVTTHKNLPFILRLLGDMLAVKTRRAV